MGAVAFAAFALDAPMPVVAIAFLAAGALDVMTVPAGAVIGQRLPQASAVQRSPSSRARSAAPRCSAPCWPARWPRHLGGVRLGDPGAARPGVRAARPPARPPGAAPVSRWPWPCARRRGRPPVPGLLPAAVGEWSPSPRRPGSAAERGRLDRAGDVGRRDDPTSRSPSSTRARPSAEPVRRGSRSSSGSPGRRRSPGPSGRRCRAASSPPGPWRDGLDPRERHQADGPAVLVDDREAGVPVGEQVAVDELGDAGRGGHRLGEARHHVGHPHAGAGRRRAARCAPPSPAEPTMNQPMQGQPDARRSHGGTGARPGRRQ